MYSIHKTEHIRFITAIILLTVLIPVLSASSFDDLKTKTGEGKTITFPGDFLDGDSAIFAFVLSDSREGGERQQQELLLWHQQLISSPMYDPSVQIYHLPVIAGAPGFVKGFIRNGLAKVYSQTVSEENIAVLFVKDAEKFAKEAGLPFGQEAVVAVVDSGGDVKGWVQGEFTSRKLDEIFSLL